MLRAIYRAHSSFSQLVTKRVLPEAGSLADLGCEPVDDPRDRRRHGRRGDAPQGQSDDHHPWRDEAERSAQDHLLVSAEDDRRSACEPDQRRPERSARNDGGSQHQRQDQNHQHGELQVIATGRPNRSYANPDRDHEHRTEIHRAEDRRRVACAPQE